MINKAFIEKVIAEGYVLGRRKIGSIERYTLETPDSSFLLRKEESIYARHLLKQQKTSQPVSSSPENEQH